MGSEVLCYLSGAVRVARVKQDAIIAGVGLAVVEVSLPDFQGDAILGGKGGASTTILLTKTVGTNRTAARDSKLGVNGDHDFIWVAAVDHINPRCNHTPCRTSMTREA